MHDVPVGHGRSMSDQPDVDIKDGLDDSLVNRHSADIDAAPKRPKKRGKN